MPARPRNSASRPSSRQSHEVSAIPRKASKSAPRRTKSAKAPPRRAQTAKPAPRRPAPAKAAAKATAKTSAADKSIKALLRLICDALDDGKAEQIAVIDLQGKSTIADYMVIASGRSQRQVVALAERLLSTIKAKIRRRPSAEGLPFGDWVLVDAGDIIVHLFRPEQRSHYNLEKMWGEDFSDQAEPAD